ncbi:hypothetical protein Pcac1_g2261 [Phytophthora cactorum]|nr:hypothetical protein Pcac1_g2261 [Phytophthora cactorum]
MSPSPTSNHALHEPYHYLAGRGASCQQSSDSEPFEATFGIFRIGPLPRRRGHQVTFCRGNCSCFDAPLSSCVSAVMAMTTQRLLFCPALQRFERFQLDSPARLEPEPPANQDDNR